MLTHSVVAASASVWGLVTATALASFVEFVEALTIVLAMGVTRGWRSTAIGAATAAGALAVITLVAGYTLIDWIPESALQLVIGALLLVFGLQWLRKAILRAAGIKAMHDEAEAFREEREAALRAGEDRRLGLDWFAFVVSFKGVFLEGLEVVFIVITLGLNADNVPLAAAGAAVDGAPDLVIRVVALLQNDEVHKKKFNYEVVLLLATFGTFWAVEGLGIFAAGHESLSWPGDDWALLALLACWLVVSQIAIRVLRRALVPRDVAIAGGTH